MQDRKLSFKLLDELLAKVTSSDAVPEYIMFPDESGELVSVKIDVKAVQRQHRLVLAARAALDRDSQSRGIPRRCT